MKKIKNSCQITNLFKGRLGVGDYWMGMLLSFMMFILLINIFAEMDVMFSLFFMLWITLKFSFSIRRAHDLNYSGWFVLLEFIPLINIYVFIKLGFFGGDSKSNKYGKKLSNNRQINERIYNLFCPSNE